MNWTLELNQRSSIFPAWAQPWYFHVKFQTIMVSFLLGIAVLLACGNINMSWKITYVLSYFLYINYKCHSLHSQPSKAEIWEQGWHIHDMSIFYLLPLLPAAHVRQLFRHSSLSFWILSWTSTLQSNTVSLSPSPAQFHFLNFLTSPHLSPYWHHLNSGPYSCLIGLVAIK